MATAAILSLLLLLAAPSLPRGAAQTTTLADSSTARPETRLTSSHEEIVVPTSQQGVVLTSQAVLNKLRTNLDNATFVKWLSQKSEHSIPPTLQETEVPIYQEVIGPTSQETVVPTSQETVVPTSQETVVPTSQETVVPTSQETVEPTSQETVVPILTEPVTTELVNGTGGSAAADPCQVCECWSQQAEAVDLVCRLPRTAVTVRGQPGNWLQIECQDESSFTCEDLPQMPYGLNSSIRLELRYCAPPRPACLAPRLSATITHLYLFYLPRTHSLTDDMLHGLDHLERFAYFGEQVDNHSISLPREAFASRPALRRLTVNKARLQLRGRDLDGVSGLEYLELSNAGLTSLPPAIFAKLSNLKKLNLWKNQIEELSREDLQGLSSLQQLDVSGNALRSLAPIAAGLPSLTVLSARENVIQVLTPLTNLQQLQQLQLFGNKVPLNISARALASLPNLTAVDLRMNSISSLPEDLLHNSSALKSLKLCNNKLSALPPGLFRDLQALEELDLSGNQLATLAPRGFESLKALKTLNLNNNRITVLPSYMVWGLCALQRLYVSGAGVRGAAGGALYCGSPQTALQELDLSRNRLASLAPLLKYPSGGEVQYQNVGSVLAPAVGSLRWVRLAHNRLSAAPDEAHACPQLQLLDLTHNNLSELMPHDLKFVSTTAEVDFRHNQISAVRLGGALPPAAAPAPASGLPPGWAEAAATRALARLDDNPYNCDCRLYEFATRLHGYKAGDTIEARIDVGSAICAAPPELRGRALAALPLRALACSSRHMAELPCAPHCSCLYTPHTKAVSLSCTEVPTKPNTTLIPDTHFELTLTQPHFNQFTFDIRVLNLSGLALKNVPETLPQGLRLLDLTNNELTEIPVNLLQSDITLRISGNKLKCDCSHKQSLRSLKAFWKNIEDGSQVVCPNGVPFSDVSVDALCSTRTAVFIGVPLALLGLVTAILALIFLRYNLEIRVWLHAKGLFKHWLAIDDENRTYDAFLSFCHKDEQFVTEQLVPGLEKGEGGWGPYKLCVHYRDWVPGEWIPAQIARSVADSRRTIIVVSKNFLDSLWGRAEFRTANMSAIKERQTRVIVILLEDISSHKELDPELKAYLSTNTYLKWGDPWFWQKLRYALPHRRQATQTTGANEKSKSPIHTKTPKDTKIKKEKSTELKETVKGLKGATGLPETLSPAGLLVPAAVPPNFVNKCEQFDIEIGNLKNMDIADLKSIKTVS